jgi:hypothetical protein
VRERKSKDEINTKGNTKIKPCIIFSSIWQFNKVNSSNMSMSHIYIVNSPLSELLPTVNWAATDPMHFPPKILILNKYWVSVMVPYKLLWLQNLSLVWIVQLLQLLYTLWKHSTKTGYTVISIIWDSYHPFILDNWGSLCIHKTKSMPDLSFTVYNGTEKFITAFTRVCHWCRTWLR